MIVLTYHKFSNQQNFENQIEYLLHKYNLSGEFENNQLLVTADDGDPSFYHTAFPILKKHKIPAILFVVTGLIDTEKPFWWDEIEYYLGKQEGNKKVWEVKNWPNKRREMFIDDLRENSDKSKLQYKQLTKDQLREMQTAGIVIANHSHTHPMFDKCTRKELEVEMALSTKILKDLGFSSKIFAYPNGNYSEESESVLKEFGIKQAYLFDHKINTKNLNSLRISRLIVNDTTPMWKFKLILSGWHTRLLPFTRFMGKLTGRLK